MSKSVEDLMAFGLPAETAKAVAGDGETGVTATGTGESDAYQITANTTQVGTVAASTGVVLPQAKLGARYVIDNNGANTLTIYGKGTDTIDGAASFSLISSRKAVFECVADGSWLETASGSAALDALTEAELAFLDGATAGTQVASKAVIADANVNTGVSKVTQLHIGASGSETQVNATAAELNKLDDSAVQMTQGSGFSLAAIYDSGVFLNGSITKTQILIDLTGLNEGGGAGDIIGDDGQANAHFGQITAALNGTIVAGRMTCLEVPAGGTADIDVHSATEGTGSEDAAISGLTNTELLNAGTWTAGAVKALAPPAANEYLYLVGQGTGDTAYTGGIFLIEFFGT